MVVSQVKYIKLCLKKATYLEKNSLELIQEQIILSSEFRENSSVRNKIKVKMPEVQDVSDDYYDQSRYQFIDRSRKNPNEDIPPIRTFRCYRDADDYLHPRVSYGKSEKETNVNKYAFERCIDVQHFKPEEISVKVENNSIVVHAKHKEKQDEQGFIMRQFTRRYELPAGCKSEDVVSSLSSDGVLSIKCAAAPVIECVEERLVPIKQTQQPAQSSDMNRTDKKGGKETPVA